MHDAHSAAVASGATRPVNLGGEHLPNEDYTSTGLCPLAAHLDAPLTQRGDTGAILGSDGSTTVGAVVRRRPAGDRSIAEAEDQNGEPEGT